MTGSKQRAAVNAGGYTRFCLTAIMVLLTLLIIGIWATGPIRLGGEALAAPRPPQTQRNILPNAGAQRLAILRAIQTTNQKLDQIKSLLESWKTQVTVVDKPAGKGVENVKKPAAK